MKKGRHLLSAAAKSQQRFWRPERHRAAARPQRGARSSERLAKVAFEVQGSQQNPTQNTVGSGWTKRGKPEEGGSAWPALWRPERQREQPAASGRAPQAEDWQSLPPGACSYRQGPLEAAQSGIQVQESARGKSGDEPPSLEKAGICARSSARCSGSHG